MTDVPLSIVQPDDSRPEPLNVLLYGPPGSGKTVAACSAPGPVLVVNADRPGSLRYARRHYGADSIREVRFQGRATIRAVLDYLRAGGDGVQTVVVDPLGEVYEKLRAEIGGRSPSQNQWGVIVAEAREFLERLRDLPYHVVLVAHEQVDDNDDGGTTRRPATGGRKLPEQAAGMVDVLAYCGAVEQEDGTVRYVGQLVQAKGRRAKDATGVLGRMRDLDVGEWVAHVHEQYRPSDVPWEEPPVGEDPTPAAEQVAA